MGKLEELIKKFENDESWNTKREDGSHRFDEKIAWIKNMVKDYAEKLNLTTDRVVEIMERKRDYSWPNYYQSSNFPGIDSDNVIGVFETVEAFRAHASKNWKGFKCPKCGEISNNPQECAHRVNKDGKCDWSACGLFQSPKGIIILEKGISLIPIFEPVALSEEKKEDD